MERRYSTNHNVHKLIATFLWYTKTGNTVKKTNLNYKNKVSVKLTRRKLIKRGIVLIWRKQRQIWHKNWIRKICISKRCWKSIYYALLRFGDRGQNANDYIMPYKNSSRTSWLIKQLFEKKTANLRPDRRWTYRSGPTGCPRGSPPRPPPGRTTGRACLRPSYTPWINRILK